MNPKYVKAQSDVDRFNNWGAQQGSRVVACSLLVWVGWLIVRGFVPTVPPADLVQSVGFVLLYTCVVYLTQLTGVSKAFWRLVGR